MPAFKLRFSDSLPQLVWELEAVVPAYLLSSPSVLFKAETYSAAIKGDELLLSLTTQLPNLFRPVPLRTLTAFTIKNP